MGAPPFKIAERTSSKAPHHSQEPELKSSKAELKRKLSTISFDADTRDCTKAEIEEIEMGQEEDHVHKG